MPRRPEPWYWEARKGWYIQVNGSQTKLGADPCPRRGKDGKPVAPAAVTREYHRLMASGNLEDEGERERATVGDVCEAFLAMKSKLQENTYRVYVYFMQEFARPNLDRRFRSLRVLDVERAADAHASWGEATKHDFVSKVGCLFRWAKEAGYLEFNPLAGHDNPHAMGRRERVMTEEEYRAIFEAADDVEFKQILGFMRGTGCRPGEARKVTAAHVHPEKPLVILGSHEHKTGRKTRRSRPLYMPKDVETMVRALAMRYPSGPLFRNSRNGRGWSKNAIPKRFRAYRKKLGLAGDVVPYLIRHATLTRLLDGGTSMQHVASIAGHVDPTTLMTTYYHADQDALLDAVDQANKAPRGRGV